MLSMELIKQTTAQTFDMPVQVLESRRTDREAAIPRHIAMWLCRRHTHHTFNRIGQAFGGRDHTTVRTAIVRFDQKKDLFRAVLARIESQLGGADIERRLTDAS